MPRALLPGRWNRHGRAIPDPQACELDNDVPPPIGSALRAGQVIPIRAALTGGRIPLRRRARRFMRELWDFLTAPRFNP